MTKENFTAIALIVDSSGSMMSVKTDTIGGINSFIDKQKESPGEVVVTQIHFKGLFGLSQQPNSCKTLYPLTPINNIKPLESKDYIPDGATALYDAIGSTIKDLGNQLALMEEQNRPSKIIVAILTDGEENASTIYKQEQIANIIKHQTEVYSWQFVFLGANQDAFDASNNIGISPANTLQYCSSSIGTASAFAQLSNSVTRTRSFNGTAASVQAFTNEDRKEYESQIGQQLPTNFEKLPERDKSGRFTGKNADFHSIRDAMGQFINKSTKTDI